MKHPDSQKFWDSLSEQHTLFWTKTPAKEEQDFRMARVGFFVSRALLTLLGVVETAFLVILFWYFLH